MMCKRFLVGIMTCLCLLGYMGCTGKTTRLNPDELSNVEQGAGLTSQDYRSVCQRMARSLIGVPAIQNAASPPTIAFVSVENRSDEYIDGDMFLNKMRKELITHSAGKILWLDRAIIDEIERENRDKGSARRTSSREGIPYGADFFLTGIIESIPNVAGRDRTVYMRYSFRLTDATNSAIVWEDDYEIKRSRQTGVVYSD